VIIQGLSRGKSHPKVRGFPEGHSEETDTKSQKVLKERARITRILAVTNF
jgi:hypothetical protein